MTNSFSSVPLTVSELTHAIKQNLESMFPLVCLQGEISNFKQQSSGHLYFSLKDSHAQIAAVMFKIDAASLKKMPQGGDQVMVKGELNVYPPKGNYQLIIRELSYVGIGALLLSLEQLKIKLHQLGWFKSIHKKPLPHLPKRIGVVTSPTGAVIQDILNVLTRRFSGFHLILNPVKVQGEGAAQEIAQAIEQFNRYRLVDVLIVGRGGGSLEDLWAFNEEIVAQAIFQSEIPIISAVGHETDHCIADYVADVRAPTPSAAAEIVIAEKVQLLTHLKQMKIRIQQTLSHLIQKNFYRLEGIKKNSLIAHPHQLIEWRMQKLDDFRLEIYQAMRCFVKNKIQQIAIISHRMTALQPLNQISSLRHRLEGLDRAIWQSFLHLLSNQRQKLHFFNQKLDYAWEKKRSSYRRLFDEESYKQNLQKCILNRLELSKQKFTHVIHLLDALNPKNLLYKGFSILFTEKEGSVISSIKQVREGQRARILLSDGEILITINELK